MDDGAERSGSSGSSSDSVPTSDSGRATEAEPVRTDLSGSSSPASAPAPAEAPSESELVHSSDVPGGS